MFSKKKLYDCAYSTKSRVRPREFTSTHSALATIFNTWYSSNSKMDIDYNYKSI